MCLFIIYIVRGRGIESALICTESRHGLSNLVGDLHRLEVNNGCVITKAVIILNMYNRRGHVNNLELAHRRFKGFKA